MLWKQGSTIRTWDIAWNEKPHKKRSESQLLHFWGDKNKKDQWLGFYTI